MAGPHDPAPARPGPPPPLGVARRGVREVGLGMITLGVVVLAFVAYQLLGTNLTEEHAQRSLQRSFETALAAHGHGHPARTSTSTTTTTTSGAGADNPTVGAPTSGGAVPSGVAVDHLVIPSIGIDKYVVEGTQAADLSEGPGHYTDTPMPGQQGNAAIAGHRTTYGAPFFRLNELKAGAAIYVTSTTGRIFVYRVVRQFVVSPDDVAVLRNTHDAQLTLTTCNPRFSATSRLIVVADLTGSAAPAATTPTSSVPAQTTPSSSAPSGRDKAVAGPVTNLGSGDGNAWPPGLAYGAAFVVLWIGVRLVINRTRRWKRLVTYVVGIVVCALPLWFCFENLVRLLPQSF